MWAKLTGGVVSIGDDEGERVVKLAREAVTRYLQTGRVEALVSSNLPKLGVFVTLNTVSTSGGESLRGCIGYPQADRQLDEAVVSAAIAAATEDPRFELVSLGELQEIVFEVSVLTPLERIVAERPANRKKYVRVGVDGLVIRYELSSGLLLPQVAVELGWNTEDYLAGICQKAGLPSDKWLDPMAELYRFQAIIYKEKYPLGPVARVALAP